MNPRNGICTTLVVLAITLAASATVRTAMEIAQQNSAPAKLVGTTHNLSDWLAAALLRNHSQKPIVSYRIGWVYVLPEKAEFHKGKIMNVPSAIQPEALYHVSAQAVPIRREASRVVFYVPEVEFADGTHWNTRNREIWPAKQ